MTKFDKHRHLKWVAIWVDGSGVLYNRLLIPILNGLWPMKRCCGGLKERHGSRREPFLTRPNA